jgi:hypothetical protein
MLARGKGRGGGEAAPRRGSSLWRLGRPAATGKAPARRLAGGEVRVRAWRPSPGRGMRAGGQAFAEPIATRMSRQRSRLKTLTLSVARVKWPITIASQMSTGSSVKNVWITKHMPIGMIT